MSDVASFVELYSGAAARASEELRRVAADFEDDLGWMADRVKRFQPGWLYLLDRGFEVEFEGATDAELTELAEMWGGFVPASIEGFLRWGGRYHALDIGVSCRVAEMLKAREAYDDLIEGAEPGDAYDPAVFRFPEGAMVLGHHGGYQFFFLVDRVDDPKVWILEAGLDAPIRYETTFSEQVVQAVEALPSRLRRTLEQERDKVERRRDRAERWLGRRS